ncbi:unnamed protein product, partial [Rotaria sp. Silwood2]
MMLMIKLNIDLPIDVNEDYYFD